MIRWIALLMAVAVLGGCIMTREVVYREPYVSSSHTTAAVPAGEPGYYGSGDYYYSPGTTYVPSYSTYASYYAGFGPYAGWGVSYFDYPVYFSLFWPLHRWYYDPFVYPSYYYGVTWFPSNYIGLSLSFGSSRHYANRWLPYSPYRYSWVDSYYDWRPWYNRYPTYRSYYPTPRYGDARIEAARLANLRRPPAPRAQTAWGSSSPASASSRRAGSVPANQGNRAADYGRLGERGSAANLSSASRAASVRRVEAGTPRVEPRTGAFGNPTRSEAVTRPALPARSTGVRDTRSAAPAPDASRSEINRVPARTGTAVRSAESPVTERSRVASDREGYALPSSQRPASRPASGISTQPPPTSVRAAPVNPAQIRSAPAGQPARLVAPAAPQALPSRGSGQAGVPIPQGQTRAPVQQPVRQANPMPARAAEVPAPAQRAVRPAPAHPASSAPPARSSERSESSRSSSNGSRGEVRRVGNSRGRR